MPLSPFSQARLDAIVKDTLAQTPIPATDHNAVAFTTDDQGVRAVIHFSRESSHGTWSAQGAYEHDWHGDNRVGVNAVYSWR